MEGFYILCFSVSGYHPGFYARNIYISDTTDYFVCNMGPILGPTLGRQMGPQFANETEREKLYPETEVVVVCFPEISSDFPLSSGGVFLSTDFINE